MGQKGNDTNVAELVPAAIEADAEIAQAAKTALKDLVGEKVNNAITALLPKSEGKTLAVLFDLIGQRRIEAMAAVGKPGRKEDLPEDFQTRELPNTRKPISELVCEGRYRSG